MPRGLCCEGGPVVPHGWCWEWKGEQMGVGWILSNRRFSLGPGPHSREKKRRGSGSTHLIGALSRTQSGFVTTALDYRENCQRPNTHRPRWTAFALWGASPLPVHHSASYQWLPLCPTHLGPGPISDRPSLPCPLGSWTYHWQTPFAPPTWVLDLSVTDPLAPPTWVLDLSVTVPISPCPLISWIS